MSDSIAAASDQSGQRGLQFVFGAVAFVAALVLLALIPSQTTWLDGQPLSKQPSLWSMVSIGGMLLFGFCELVSSWRRLRRDGAGAMVSQVVYLVRAIEFAAWFMVYVTLVPLVGYLPTTLVFCALLTLRAGYRTRKLLVCALLTGLVTVLIFKSFLSVKIPGAAVYEYLPAALRNFMILYL